MNGKEQKAKSKKNTEERKEKGKRKEKTLNTTWGVKKPTQ